MNEITYQINMIIYAQEPNGDPNFTKPMFTTTEKVTISLDEVPEEAEPENYAAEWLEFVVRERESLYKGMAHFYVDEYTEFHWLKENKAPMLPIFA